MNPRRASRILLLAAAMLGGCIANPPTPGDAAYRATLPREQAPAPTATGSIYQAGQEMVLFEDRRARRVGDVLTVVLSEATDATKKASTSLSKTTDETIAKPTVFGSILQTTNKNILNGVDASISSDNKFDGSADTKQNNSLTGTITVTVAEVLANGNLRVQGEKWVKINAGEEYVRLSGIVRPEDIGADNSVRSTQVADAHIAYSGQGQDHDVNVMGWLSRFFVSAFFPL